MADTTTTTAASHGASASQSQTRRVHLWLKTSLSNLSSSSEKVDFGECILQNDNNNNRTTSNNNNNNPYAGMALERLPICQNIDEAMGAFHSQTGSYPPPLPVYPTSSSSSCRHYDNDNDYDWLLDGDKAWQADAQQSRELLESMKADDIDEMLKNHGIVMGQQHHQFASFEVHFDQAFSVQKDDDDDDDDDDEFGEFQQAKPDSPAAAIETPSNEPHQGNDDDDDDDKSNCHDGPMVMDECNNDEKKDDNNDDNNNNNNKIQTMTATATIDESNNDEKKDDEIDDDNNCQAMDEAKEETAAADDDDDDGNNGRTTDEDENSTEQKDDEMKGQTINDESNNNNNEDDERRKDDKNDTIETIDEKKQDDEMKCQTMDESNNDEKKDDVDVDDNNQEDENDKDEPETTNVPDPNTDDDDEFGSFQSAKGSVAPSGVEQAPPPAAGKDNAARGNHPVASRPENYNLPTIVVIPDLEPQQGRTHAGLATSSLQEEDMTEEDNNHEEDDNEDKIASRNQAPANDWTISVPASPISKILIGLCQNLPISSYDKTKQQRQRQRDHDFDTDTHVPERFFREEDDTLKVLWRIPWEHVALWQSMAPVETHVVDEYITQQLSTLDDAHGKVSRQLLAKIAERKSSIELCNNMLSELDQNVSLAEMHLHQSHQSVVQARGNQDDCTGLAGGYVLLQLWDRQHSYTTLDSLLSKCAKLLNDERGMHQRIEALSNDPTTYGGIVEEARVLWETAHRDPDLKRLACLESLRARSNHSLDVLLEKLEQILTTQLSLACRSSSSSWSSLSIVDNYERLVKGMVHVALDQRGSTIEPSRVADRWSRRVRQTLLWEADICLARSLLDPTNAQDSEYDKELVEYSYELRESLGCGGGDAAKLGTIAHNLVTIRFDFEASLLYLPRVYHRLCLLLTNVLHSHCVLTKWHKEYQKSANNNNNDEKERQLLDILLHGLLTGRSELWQRCEAVLMRCLDEYLDFAGKKKLFRKKDKSDDSLWVRDLVGLHAIFVLTHQFMSLREEFINDNNNGNNDPKGNNSPTVSWMTTPDDDNSVCTKLKNVFRKHLRGVHVEAMNTMGMTLSKEAWKLVGCNKLGESSRGESKTEDVMLVLGAVSKVFLDAAPEIPPSNLLCTAMAADKSRASRLGDDGNPFALITDMANPTTRQTFDAPVEFEEAVGGRLESFQKVSEMLLEMAGGQIGPDSQIGLASTFNGFTKWVARLVTIAKMLPVIAGDVAKVVENLSDLHVTTVFRLCVGNAPSERIVLGVDGVAPFAAVESARRGSKRKGWGGKAKSSGSAVQQITVGSHVASEIFAPLPNEVDGVAQLQKFISRGQDSLRSIVSLDKIEKWLMPKNSSSKDPHAGIFETFSKRECAAWSMLLVASVLCVASVVATKGVESTLVSLGYSLSGAEEELADQSLSLYAAECAAVAPVAVMLGSKIACSRAVQTRQLVEKVSQVLPFAVCFVSCTKLFHCRLWPLARFGRPK